MRSRLLAILLVFTLASPSFSDPTDLVTQMRSVVASGRPTPQLMNAYTKLPNFELDVNATTAALRAFKIQPTAAQALMGISHVSKHGDRLIIRTKGELALPVVMDGQVKGWAKLHDPVSLRIRPSGAGVVIDQIQGVEVGPWKSLTVDLKHVNEADWQPGSKNSTLAVSASLWIFSTTLTFALPNPGPAPSSERTPPKAPSRTSGFANRLPGD